MKKYQIYALPLLANLLFSALVLPAQKRDILILKCTPSTLFNPDRPHLLLNAELRLDRYLGIEVSWGLPAYFMDQILQSNFKTEQQLQIARAEVRVYPWIEEPFYFAAEGFRIYEMYQRGRGSYFNTNKEFLSYSSATIQRSIWGAGIKFGRVLMLGEYIRFEIYSGAGIRERNIAVVAENAQATTPPRLIFGPRLTEGRAILPQLLLGLRIGFAFKTRTSAPAFPTTNNTPAGPRGPQRPYSISAGHL